MGLPVPQETLDKALNLLSKGKTLTAVAKTLKRDRSALSRLFHQNPEIEARYEQAVKDGIEANLEEAFTEAAGAKDNFQVQKARLVADNAKWLASKRFASVYGDKVQADIPEGLTILLGIRRGKQAE